MRWPLIIVVVLGFAGLNCTNDYNPPQPYGVGAHYGGNGVAYAGQAGGVQFLLEDVLGNPEVTGGDVDTFVFELPADWEVTTDYQTCLADAEPFNSEEYCWCLEQYFTAGTGSEEECKCNYVYCIPEPSETVLNLENWTTELQTCYAYGIFTGLCGTVGQ
jgi:hypothetical protein